MKNLNFEIKSKSDVVQSMYLSWSLEITKIYKFLFIYKSMAPFSNATQRTKFTEKVHKPERLGL